MGYTVADLALTKSYVLANGMALFLAYLLNYLSQFVAMLCFSKDKKRQAGILQRLLESSRVLYWFGIATMFSMFPPFYYGLHNAVMGWVTLLLVVLMHIFCFVVRCDQERSVWSYCYYFYHFSAFVWMVAALGMGYYWAEKQTVPPDSIQN